MTYKHVINQFQFATNDEYCCKIKFKLHPDNPLQPAEFLWLFKHREKNGFAKAFIKVSSKNFLVHIPTFAQCVSRSQALEAVKVLPD
jgi:hypothetical protein